MSARSAVAETLARIEADRSGAVVTVLRTALKDADELDRARSAGALAGVPFTAKDVIATAGSRTTAASRAFTDHIPEEDAPAVARFRDAGAILVGKTNCSELALSAWTGNPLFGETRNPRHEGRSPGGSSGGCAAAIAAGLVPLSLGTDYGGSIRFPAACCGIVGLRPTPGRIPSAGQVPAPDPDSPRAEFSLIGPLGRTVHDLSAAFPVLAADSRPGSPPSRAIALATGPSTPATPALRHAADALRAPGLEVVVARMPWLPEAGSTFSGLRALDTYDDLRPVARRLGPALQQLVAAAPVTADASRREMLEQQRARLAEAALADLDPDAVLILPIADCEMPPPAGRAVDPETLWPARAISLLGLPAVAVAGIQVVGPPHGDETVLAAAELIERSLGPARRPVGSA